MPVNRRTVLQTCRWCGTEFSCRKDHVDRGGGQFCSIKCSSQGKTRPFEASPVEDRLKVRSHGLINMRVKRGLMTKPDRCEACGSARKLDAHHDNYDEPANVRWLCRSCHMKVHAGTLKDRVSA